MLKTCKLLIRTLEEFYARGRRAIFFLFVITILFFSVENLEHLRIFGDFKAQIRCTGRNMHFSISTPLFQTKMKKRSERCKHCAPAAVPPPHRRTESAMAAVRHSKKSSPTADPLPGGAGLPKFNQPEMVTTCSYRPSSVKIDARNFELSR